MISTLTQDRLKQLLSYDPETGDFTRILPGVGYRVGDIAGAFNSDGYRNIRVDGRMYGAHRLAWLYMTGKWPVGEVDHKDRQRGDNRFANLREASTSQNECNKPGTSSCGRKGVYWNRIARKWHASVQFNRQRHYLGLFKTLEEAAAAYDAAALKIHGAFANVNSKQAANNSGDAS